MRRWLAFPLLAIAAGSVLPAPAGASLRQIAVGNFYFEDDTADDGKVEVRVGDQLRFLVLDGGPGTPHTVEVDELGIHSGSLASGETFTTPPLTTAGTFILYCKPHVRRGHQTTLIVSGTSSTPTTAPPVTTTSTAPAATSTTTAQPTTTTKPPSTTTATKPSTTTTTTGAVAARPGSSSTTEPVVTTTSAVNGTGPTAPADRGAPPAVPGEALPTGPADDDPTGNEAALAPVGRGTLPDDLTGATGGSFEELLKGRMSSGDGPWTRSVRLALAALVPMALAAGAALWRRPIPPPDHDEK